MYTVGTREDGTVHPHLFGVNDTILFGYKADYFFNVQQNIYEYHYLGVWLSEDLDKRGLDKRGCTVISRHSWSVKDSVIFCEYTCAVFSKAKSACLGLNLR